MSKSWKDGLLSSGLPLEYDVAQQLWARRFTVSGEFPYTRFSGRTDEDFSVDIGAHRLLTPPSHDDELLGELNVLCECKYRAPGKTWLLTPDKNDSSMTPYPPVIRQLERFTTFEYDTVPILEFCDKFPRALKGTEIHSTSGDAHDKDIRHAINQLRYALPIKIKNIIESFSWGHPTDGLPNFILPALITNAELRLLKPETNLADVIESKDLAEISTSIESVVIHSQHAEDFKRHCAAVFEDTTPKSFELSNDQTLQLTNKYWQTKKSRNVISPYRELRMFAQGSGPDFGYFEQFLVVNDHAFPKVLEELLKTLEKSLSASRQVVISEAQ